MAVGPGQTAVAPQAPVHSQSQPQGAPVYGHPQPQGAPVYGQPQAPGAPVYGQPQAQGVPVYGQPQGPGNVNNSNSVDDPDQEAEESNNEEESATVAAGSQQNQGILLQNMNQPPPVHYANPPAYAAPAQGAAQPVQLQSYANPMFTQRTLSVDPQQVTSFEDSDVADERSRVEMGRVSIEEEAIVLRGLCKSYGKVPAVDHLSLAIAQGKKY